MSTPSTPPLRPPKKKRDVVFDDRREQSPEQSRTSYIGHIFEQAGKTLIKQLQESASPGESHRVRVGQKRRGQVEKLRVFLNLEEQQVLNAALAYAYWCWQAGTLDLSQWRKRIRREMDGDATIDLFPEARIQTYLQEVAARDARYVLLNAGLDVLIERLDPLAQGSTA